MNRKQALRIARIPFLFFVCCALQCGKGSVSVVNMGGSEVVGKLVTVSNSPVADARIVAYKIPSDTTGLNLDIVKKMPPADTAVSDAQGRYSFSRLDTGYYHLFAAGKSDMDSLFVSHDSVYIDYFAPPSQPAHRVDVGVDTMRAPGWITGKVVLEPGFESSIVCYIPGSSLISITNDTGGFTLVNVPAGAYTIYYRDFTGLYDRVKDSNVVVVSKQKTGLSEKVMHLSAQGIPPAPKGLRAAYDTLEGRVYLSWKKVNVADVAEYLVFRKASTPDSFVQVGTIDQPDTLFIDKVYTSTQDTAPHVYIYEIFSRDDGQDVGPHSDPCSVSVISPASIRTFLALQANHKPYDTVAVFDNVPITCMYTNEFAPIESLFWILEKPDSVVRTKEPGNRSGSDTLIIAWDRTGMKTVYCTAVDAAGRKRTDSIMVVVVQDEPFIRFLSADTVIEFGGTVRCSIDVGHRFGNCSLSIDLNRDSNYEIKRRGLTFDTVFSTNTDALSGKISIRITDDHRNTLDTFFIVTIGPVPLHNYWEECDSMFTARKFCSVCVIDNTLYALGGCKRQFSGANTPKAIWLVEAYNDSSWTMKDSMKVARYSFASCVYNGSIYVFGGTGTRGYTNSIEKYDPAANSWSLLGDMPFSRAGAASCVYENKLYLFGGRMPYQPGDDSVSNGIYTYDFSSNQWSSVIGRMMTRRYEFQAVVRHNRIYLIGGRGGSAYALESEALSSVELFDPSSNQCSTGPRMNSGRSYFAAVSMDDTVFIIGGVGENGKLVNDISVFSPLEGAWATRSIFPVPHAEGRHGAGAGVVGGKIVVVGGGTDLDIDNPGYADGVVRKYYP